LVFDQKEEFSTMTNQNQSVNNDRPGTFQEKTVPAETRLAGWAWPVPSFGVRAPSLNTTAFRTFSSLPLV
jgi:hypothetical protein